MSHHPTEGARFLFELESSDDDGAARYRLTVFTPAQSFAYAARITEDGSATLTEQSESADASLADSAGAIAKTIGRGAAKNRAAGLSPWPRRVLRWRGPGRGR